jgi:tryptophanyl-tRNA synthetase
MALLEAHYEQVRAQRGYDAADVEFGSRSASANRRRFAFTEDAATLRDATPAETLVSVGISLTGTPHVGTLGQLETAVALQRAGFDVQLILADLVVYNGRGLDLETARDRGRRYRELANAVGFDEGRGRVQIQSRSRDVLHSAFLLARDYHGDQHGPDDEPTAFETELADAYDDVETPSDASALSQQLVGLLLVADNVHPLLTREYERVVLALGADNGGMARGIDAVRSRAGVPGSVVGLFTRLVGGLDGVPKMSKSIPGSDVHLDMAPERIRELVSDPDLDADRPTESIAYQMMRLASPFSADRLDEVRAACLADSESWNAARREYADYLANLAITWQETAGDGPAAP